MVNFGYCHKGNKFREFIKLAKPMGQGKEFKEIFEIIENEMMLIDKRLDDYYNSMVNYKEVVEIQD